MPETESFLYAETQEKIILEQVFFINFIITKN